MLSILIPSLFISASVAAAIAIATSISRFGRAWLALPEQLAAADRTFAVSWQLVPSASCEVLTAPLPRWRDPAPASRTVRTTMPAVRPQAARRAAA